MPDLPPHSPAPPLIDRRFVRVAEGLIHLRSAGSPGATDAPPLYMAHAGPGSSRGLIPLIGPLGRARFVVAPDMLGNGDSDPPGVDSVDIGFHVDRALAVMDALELERVDFYGSHTGAQIGLQLAVRHPDRVRRLIVDGLALFDVEMKADLLAHYAPAKQPDDHGGQFAWAWNFVRDQFWHFPYFRRDAEHRIVGTAVPPAEAIHAAVVDVLKALTSYHLAYRAAFSQDVPPLLREVRIPTLMMCVQGDPLASYLPELAALRPDFPCRLVARGDRVAEIERFLA